MECCEDKQLKRLLINGIGGQMGRALLNAVSNGESGFEPVCGVDPFFHGSIGIPVYSCVDDIDIPVDVAIDFSVPKATKDLLSYCLKTETPVVICTTALSEELIAEIDKASKIIPVFRSGNMSVGINLMRALLKMAKQTLGDSFDVEIIEAHHNRKKDAPSGTALMLADAIGKADGEEHPFVFGRREKDHRREPGEIGFHSIRGGTIVGEHEVRFLGEDEEISIRHEAYSKRVFANGALRAASFLLLKKNGLYSMEDLVSEMLH